MKRRLKEGRRRNDIAENVSISREGMEEKREDLDVDASDHETVVEVRENLEGEGTEEGVAEVRDQIERARDVTEDIFEADGEDLEDIQDEAKDSQDDLEERSEAVGRDVEKVSDGLERIQLQETTNELRRAEESARGDREFLDEHIEQLDEAIEKSETEYEELKARVRAGGGDPK